MFRDGPRKICIRTSIEHARRGIQMQYFINRSEIRGTVQSRQSGSSLSTRNDAASPDLITWEQSLHTHEKMPPWIRDWWTSRRTQDWGGGKATRPKIVNRCACLLNVTRAEQPGWSSWWWWFSWTLRPRRQSSATAWSTKRWSPPKKNQTDARWH